VDFWDLTKLVLRRWYVAVPLLVLTSLAAMYTTYNVKPDYKATAYVQLIPPPEASITKNIKALRNPWLDLGLGALNTAATYATVDRQFLNQLKTRGMSDNVVITNGYPAPIATIEVIGSSKEMAMGTADDVVQRFTDVVKSLQDDYAVQSPGRILTRRLDTGNNLEETGGKVKRALVAVAGAGALMTAGLTIGFDALARRRTRRKAKRDGAEAEVPGTAAHVPERPQSVSDHVGASSFASPGERTVKIPVQNDRARAVPAVNGASRAKGPVRTSGGELEAPADATIVLPRPGYGDPGEGGGSKR
jgi:hypothetical protein